VGRDARDPDFAIVAESERAVGKIATLPATSAAARQQVRMRIGRVYMKKGSSSRDDEPW
jgi:hypothetical protein